MNDHLRKLCAIVLLLLIVSPVTAPFSICTIRDLAAEQSGDGAVLSLPPAPMSALDEGKSIIDVVRCVLTTIAPPPEVRHSIAVTGPLALDPITPLVLRI